MFFIKLLVVVFSFFLYTTNTYAISDTAISTIVMDTDSGRVLYEKNADEKRLIASITKIMTAVVAIENGNVNDYVTVGDEVLSMYGSSIYIKMGEKMTLKDLLYGLMLRSGNDAAIVIANYVGKTEEGFVKLMNEKANKIGMKNTTYRNSHGLDESTQNYSTARDMAILSTYANKIDLYRKIVSTKKWTVETQEKTYIWNNRNKLLYSYKYATGGKTGYTPKAGRTLVTTASKDNLNLTVVTLNDSNEYITHESLYEYCFDKYKNYIVVDKNNFQVDQNFFSDELYIKESFVYPLSDKEKEKVKIIIKLYKNVNYDDKTAVGRVLVKLDSDIVFETNVYVKNTKNKKSGVLYKLKKFFKGILKRNN